MTMARVVALALLALLAPAAAVSPVMACAGTHCGDALSTCSAQSGCNAILQCRDDCFANAPSKLAEVDCLASCTSGSSAIAAQLWADLLGCIENQCPDEIGTERCTGFVDANSCEGVDGCSFVNAECRFGDFVPPVISDCPLDITLPSDQGTNTRTVAWPAISAADGDVTVVPSLVEGNPSGSKFTVGTTDVVFVAVDAAGNSATCNFTVTIEDVWDPVFSHCPANQTINADDEDIIWTSSGLAVVRVTWVEPIASDNVGFTFTNDSPQSPTIDLPVGTHEVVYTAVDAAQNSATCSFYVSIEASAISFFRRIPHRVITNSFEGGFFTSHVPPETCAEKCLADAQCRSFSVDSAGDGLCMLSYEDQTSANYVADLARTYFERQNMSSQTCVNLVAAEACFDSSGLEAERTSVTTDCFDKLVTYQTCIEGVIQDCPNQVFRDALAAIVEEFTDLCGVQSTEAPHVPESFVDDCRGPFSKLVYCVDCCDVTEEAEVPLCKASALAPPSESCLAAVRVRLDECYSACYAARPFSSSGTVVDDVVLGSGSGDSPDPDPPVPTGQADLDILLQHSFTFDDAKSLLFLLGVEFVYGLDANLAQLVHAGQRVTVSSRILESFSLPAHTQSLSRNRRELGDGADMLWQPAHHGMAVLERRSAPQQRRRRSLGDASQLSQLVAGLSQTEAGFLAATLAASFPDYFGNGTVDFEGANVQFSQQREQQLSQITTTAAPTTTASGTTVSGGGGGGGGSGTTAPTTTTTTTTTTTSANNRAGFSTSTDDDDTRDWGLVLLIILGVLFLMGIIAILLKMSMRPGTPRRPKVIPAETATSRYDTVTQVQSLPPLRAPTGGGGAPRRGGNRVAPLPAGAAAEGGDFNGIKLPPIVSRNAAESTA